jgi:hypothetical protein
VGAGALSEEDPDENQCRQRILEGYGVRRSGGTRISGDPDLGVTFSATGDGYQVGAVYTAVELP